MAGLMKRPGSDCQGIGPFVDMEHGTPTEFDTKVAFLWDDTYFMLHLDWKSQMFSALKPNGMVASVVIARWSSSFLVKGFTMSSS